MKNDAPQFCPIIFSPDQFFQRPRATAHSAVAKHLRALWEEPDITPIFSYYRAPAADVWARLEIMGYGPGRAQSGWVAAREAAQRWADVSGSDRSWVLDQDRQPATFEEWCSCQRRQFETAGPYGMRDGLFNLDWEDPLAEFAAKLLAVDPTTVWADLTDVIESGYIEDGEHPHDAARPSREKVDLAFEKILVLTEGASDKRIITEAIERFYPKLSDFYSFVDFEGFRVEGGASPMARLLKGLVGAGFQGRVIALFDNDAPGHAAAASLRLIPFTDNVKVVTLPEIEFAEKYPTVGPTGEHVVNINGSGCAIELYLGRQSLTLNGKLIPLRWAEYNHAAKRYHGNLDDKLDIQERFLASISEETSSTKLRMRYPEMDKLLRTIFSVFA